MHYGDPSVIFINYEDILPDLLAQGLIEVVDEDGLIRLEMGAEVEVEVYHVADPASRVVPYPGAAVISRPTSALPGIIEQTLNKLHLNEVLVIPVDRWSGIVDCIAFEMATDESWSEIDAMMAMHQNSRNALSISRSEMPVLIKMIRTLLAHAEGPAQDIIITSDVRPVLFEIFSDGALSVTSDIDLIEQFGRSAVG